MGFQDEYYLRKKEILGKNEVTQKEALEESARAIAEVNSHGGVFHIMDTGHMLMYEGVGRSGV
jgi:uncharacterized phosphosugar-binding protein